MNLLPIRNAGERPILPADEDAGMKHQRDQKARLAFGGPVTTDSSVTQTLGWVVAN